MTKPAAFQASYTDWRVIKGRKVVSVCFEVPIEHADLAYQALGGMPNPAAEVWCGIARIQQASGGSSDPSPPDEPLITGRPAPVEESRATKSFRDLPPQQQAGIIAKEPPFWRFVEDNHETRCEDEDDAVTFIRNFCHVESRRDLASDHRARVLWNGLSSQYTAWKLADKCGVAR